MTAVLNRDRRVLSGPGLLHGLIANADDDAVAVEFLLSDQSRVVLTYAEFRDLSWSLTRHLQQFLPTDGSSTVIPVVIPQSPQLYVAWRAVLQAGACFCPVAPDIPSERLKFILRDVSADLLLCLDDSTELIRSVSDGIRCLSVALEDLRRASSDDMRNGNAFQRSCEIDPRSPAYVMYTSGSTGLPKGVQMSHVSATQSLLAHDEHIPHFKRFLQFASPTFDVSIFEIFFPFYRGATLVSRSREHMLADLPSTITALHADAAELTPTVAGTLLGTREAAPCLRLLLTIGEMLTQPVIREFGGSNDRDSMLYAMYGPTEAAIHCTVAPALSASASVRNIGGPLSTVTALILREGSSDQSVEVVDRGRPGELVIGGQLANGYLNRPDQNEAAFIELPAYGRMYRTGDRAICHDDGQLEILGRMASGQVKLRGQRVELGEIEEIATKTEGVSQACASVIEDSLVLFCAVDVNVKATSIQTTCKSWLPPFMRPGDIVLFRNGLPALPSGKVDRKQLEADYQASIAISNDTGHTLESAEDDRFVINIVRRELGKRLARTDDLWSQGMDSLRAIKIASALRPRYPAIMLSHILRSTTLTELVGILEGLPTTSYQASEPDLIEDSSEWSTVQAATQKAIAPDSQDAIDSVQPCTPIQLAMLAETAIDSKSNFNRIELRRHPRISEELLWDTLARLADRTPILRSGFVRTGTASMPFARVVWRSLSSAECDLEHPLQLIPRSHDDSSLSCLVIHHALYDGWSWDLVVNDMNHLLAGEEIAPRPEFDIVSRCIRRNIPQAVSDPSLSFWSNLLQNRQNTPFPTLCASKPTTMSRQVSSKCLQTSYQQLSSLAAELHITKQTILQASWALLLSAYTDNTDVTFGTVISGRHAPIQDIETVVGPCLATIPTRLDLSRVRTVQDLLHYIQRQNVGTLQFYDTPLSHISRAAGITSADRLFDTLVVWQESPSPLDGHSRLLETVAQNDALDYATVLELEPVGDRCHLKITYDPDKLASDQAQVLLSQLDNIMDLLTHDVDLEIPAICHRIPHNLLSISNHEQDLYQGTCDLALPLARSAEQVPNRTAIRFVTDFDPDTGSFKTEDVSYRDLFDRARRLKDVLLDQYDVKPDDLVCFMAAKNVQLYVGILASVMSGAGYLCIDPNQPTDRVRQITEQAQPTLVVTDLASRLDGITCVSTTFDCLSNANASTSLRSPVSVDGEHLAYAVFTSGTTGVPKGVLITRRNLASHISMLEDLYPHQGATDALLQACSPAFDVSVFEIFWTWHMGMTLVSASNDVLFRNIEAFIDALDVTHLSMTPSVAALVHPDNIPQVKMLVTAGEPMNSKVFETWSGLGLYQGYGPSETTNICNVRRLVQPQDAYDNVGPAFANTSMFVCRRLPIEDRVSHKALTVKDFHPVPRGAVGEIWLGGDQVGRGYTDAVLTDRAFLQHPDHGWLYRSGDMGRLLADDTLVILGREDDQAKLRGQRIELGEVNNALLKVDSVADAVTVIGHHHNETRMFSFIALQHHESTQTRPTVHHVFERLEHRLPAYMIPDAIIPITTLPLTSQGKIDKKKLLEDIQGLPDNKAQICWRQQTADDTDEEPMTDSAKAVATALAETLSIAVETIKPSTSFYALGLDSLSAVRFSQHLAREGLPRVDVSRILANPSVKTLSTALGANGHIEKHGSPITWEKLTNCPAVRAVANRLEGTGQSIERVLPCTDLQSSMLSSSRDSSGNAYQNKLTFKVNGNSKRLQSAWTEVMSRQPLLRTFFIDHDDADMPFLQIVLDRGDLPWSEEIARASTGAMSLDRWWRIVIQRHAGELYLELNMHHALYDAAAMMQLLAEVQQVYNRESLNAVNGFDQYLEYAHSLDTEETLSFWKSQLKDVRPTRLASLLQKDKRSRKQESVHVNLRHEVTLNELEGLAKQLSVPMIACLQATLARTLARYTDSLNICFGNVFSGRNLPINGVDRVIGPCFNTLPMQARFDKDGTNLELLRVMQQTNIDIIPYQPSSLRTIQREISPDGKALFDVLLLLQQDEADVDGEIWDLVDEEGDMFFPFILEVTANAVSNSLDLTLHSTVALDHALVEILHDFADLLKHTLRYPEARAHINGSQPSFLQDKLPMQTQPYMNGHAEESNDRHLRDLTAFEAEVAELMLSLSSRSTQSISAETTIFRLGLDSINAVQLATKLRQKGYNVTSSDILEAPSVAEIAASCVGAAAEEARPTTSDAFNFPEFEHTHQNDIRARFNLANASVESIRPCTPLQCALLSQYLHSGGSFYYNTLTLKLKDYLPMEKLEMAWQMVVQRHEMLRTGFAECDDATGSFLMVTYTLDAAVVPWLDQAVDGQASSGAGSVDYLIDPPWHLHLTENGKCLEIGILHALYDAYSLDMILADLAGVCHGSELQPTPPLRPTLSSILAAASSDDPRSVWTQEKVRIEPTKFPNLSIFTNISSKFAVTERRMVMPLEDINGSCVDLECTLQAACQTAWARLLSAYTGQDRVTFGLIVSGRNYGDARDGVAFPCINTLPFTTDVAPATKDMLRTVSKINSGLLRNQQTPLTSIKRWQGIEEEPFNTILVLQKHESNMPEEVPWEIVDETARAEYAVSLEVVPDDKNNAIDLRLTYSEALVPSSAATFLLKQYEEHLMDVLHDQARPSEMESSLEPVEPRLTTSVKLLHGLLEATASKTPDTIALEYVTGFERSTPKTQVWSYLALDREGNRIANLLLAHGVNTTDLVATCFEKCPEASFAILGVLKAGGAYVAIDPGAPVDRKRFILGDAGCKIVLTTTNMVDEFSSLGVTCLAVDNDDLLKDMSHDRPVLAQPVNPGDTCYCLYTSGTTGTPKGCLISHDSAVQAMMSFQRIFEGHWTADSRWLQFASFHFDVSVLEQYWSWSVGICMVTAPRDLILEDLPAFLKQTKITHLDLTPSLARLISPEEVPSLCDGVFIVGGEQVIQDIIDTWGTAGCLYNFYGPSEVTIGCTVHPRVRKGTKPTNVGQLWDNVGAHVLRPGTEEVVIRGAVGELCLTGVLVGKGYLNRPELMKEKFAVMGNGQRIYRTGDLVRLLHDDSFEFLGRIDDQVKLRGQRLEIGEIDQVIRAGSKDISGVATLVLKHPSQGKEQLVSFITIGQASRNSPPDIVSDEASSNLIASVRRHCSDKMSGYMVPTVFLVVSRLPLSANNKVDKKALKTLYEASETDTGYEDSMHLNEKQQTIFDQIKPICARSLRIEEKTITLTARLFELGLDSVSAIGFARALCNHGFEAASIQTVMRCSTMVDLVRALQDTGSKIESNSEVKKALENVQAYASRHEATIAEALAVPLDQIEHISPCTALQEGMISKAVNGEPQDTTYFADFAFELGSDVDIKKNFSAWKAVEGSISILRTCFVPTEDGYAQVVLKQGHQSKPSADHPDQDFQSWVRSAKAFGTTLPWHVFVTATDGVSRLVLWIFHGLYDGIALDLLLEKAAQAYTTGKEDVECSNFYELLPHGPLLQQQGSQEFWKGALPVINKLDLPWSTRGTAESLQQHTEVVLSNITELCSKLSITPPAFFQAVWLLCLYQSFDVNPTLGIVVSGRSISHPEAESVIGPMFNTLPCSIVTSKDDRTIRDLMQACHKFNIDSLPYHHTPLRQIAKWLGHDASQGLFDSLFVFQRERAKTSEHGLWKALPSVSQPDYPLNLEIEQKKGGGFFVTIVARSEHLGAHECKELLNSYTSLLERCCGDVSMVLPDAFIKQANSQGSGTSARASTQATGDQEHHTTDWTPAARKVREELAKVAGVDEQTIGLTRPSIFEIGLDSIDAMKLATRLKNAGIKVPISAIMRATTVEGISAAAQHSQAVEQSSTSAGIQDQQEHFRELLADQDPSVDQIEVVVPVTPMQEGLLIDYAKYYNVAAYELPKTTDLVRLQKAWQNVALEQPILRTRFASVEDGGRQRFLQVVLKEPNVEVKFLEQPSTVKIAVQRMKDDAGERELAMPILMLSMFVSNGTSHMAVGMPHAAYDGWSIQLLHQAVAEQYRRLETGQFVVEKISPAAMEQHLDAVQVQTIDSSIKAFWQSMVEQMTPSTVPVSPTDREKSAQLFQHGSKSNSVIAQQFCKVQGITMQSLGLAAWSVALAKRSKQFNVCFGLVLSGRTTEGSEDLLFPTFNTVIFNSQLQLDDTGKQLVNRIHESALSVSEHQHFPLREVLQKARAKHGPEPMFNTLFTYQKAPTSNERKVDLYSEVEIGNDLREPPYAVNIELEVNGDELVMTLASQQGVFTAEEAQSVLEDFDRELVHLIDTPEASLFVEIEQSAFRTITPRERAVAAPQNAEDKEHELEETGMVVRQVLAELSGTPLAEIRASTNLFNLGLDSISAIKLSTMLRKRGLRLPISKLIELQTVNRIAEAIDANKNEQSKPESQKQVTNGGHNLISQHASLLNRHKIEKTDVESVLPATAGQSYMLETWQSSGGRLFYPTFWLEVKDMSNDELDRAMQLLMDTTPMLRTTFVRSPSGTIQVCLAPQSARNYKDRLPWTYEVKQRVNGSNLFVTLRIHHALYDAISIELLVKQLDHLCHQQQPLQQNNDMDAYISSVISLSQSDKLKQREVWTSYLKTDDNESPEAVSKGSFSSPRISRFEPHLLPAENLTARLRLEGVGIQAIFFTIVGQVYASHLRQCTTETRAATPDAVVLGVYLALRNLDIPDLQVLAAPTVNIVPLRIPLLNAERSAWDVARQVQHDLALIGQAQHCGVSLKEVFEWTGIKVGCVVNFLSVSEPDGDGGENKRVWHTDPQVKAEMGVDEEKVSEAPVPILGEEAGDMPWCVPTMDVEAKVEDGYLAMGVWALADVLGGGVGEMERWFEGVREGFVQAEGKGKGRSK